MSFTSLAYSQILELLKQDKCYESITNSFIKFDLSDPCTARYIPTIFQYTRTTIVKNDDYSAITAIILSSKATTEKKNI